MTAVMVEASMTVQATAHVSSLVVHVAREDEMEVGLIVMTGPTIDCAFAGTVAHTNSLTIAFCHRGGTALTASRVGSAALLLAHLTLGYVLCAAGAVTALSSAVVPDVEVEWVSVVVRLHRVAIPIHQSRRRTAVALGPVVLAAVPRGGFQRREGAIQLHGVHNILRLRQGAEKQGREENDGTNEGAGE